MKIKTGIAYTVLQSVDTNKTLSAESTELCGRLRR